MIVLKDETEIFISIYFNGCIFPDTNICDVNTNYTFIQAILYCVFAFRQHLTHLSPKSLRPICFVKSLVSLAVPFETNLHRKFNCSEKNAEMFLVCHL